MESVWTAATTAASSAISLANAHPAAKVEAAVVGVTGVVEEAEEEDAALRVPANKTIMTLPQPPTRGLRVATMASSRRSRVSWWDHGRCHRMA